MEKQDIILIEKLQQLKGIQPKNEWRVLFKEKLNAEMGLIGANHKSIQTKGAASEKEKIFIALEAIREFFQYPRTILLPKASFAMAAFIALFVIYGGTIVSYSAAKSLPGDKFYEIKLAAEKIKFVLTSDEEKRVGLRFEFLNNRLLEMGAAANLNEPEDAKAEKVAAVVNAIRQEMNDINLDFDKFDKKTGTAEPEKAAKMAKSIDKSINTYSKTLAAAAVNLPATVKEKIKPNVKETIKIAEETSNKTLMVLIEKHKIAPVATNDELAQRVEEKISDTESKLKNVQDKAQSNDAINEALINNSAENMEKNADDKKTIETTSSIAQAMLAEARVKLQTNDLSGALKNATASESIVKATENIIDAAVMSTAMFLNGDEEKEEIVNEEIKANQPASGTVEKTVPPSKTPVTGSIVSPAITVTPSIAPTITPALKAE